jgi:hypothetical protein
MPSSIKKTSKQVSNYFRNYAQAMKCYLQAQRNDPENFNVIRDVSYLQLYLRQYNSFLESARKSVEVRSNLMVNWATYAFACYLVKYELLIFRLEIIVLLLNFLILQRVLAMHQ